MGTNVKVLRSNGEGSSEPTVTVVVPKGQGVTYEGVVYPLTEDNEFEMDFATAIELMRLGNLRIK